MLMHHSSVGPSRRAVVLLAVLVIIVLLSLAAYKYNDYTLAEYRAADSAVRATQARAFAESGVHYTAAMLTDITDNLSSNPWNNPSMFQNISINQNENNNDKDLGRFTILSLLSPDALTQQGGGQPYTYGVTDESSKINLNALLNLDNGQGNAGYAILMALPNMTDDIANSILDWLDPDENPRSSGAESDYYGGMNPPYQAKNGPMDTLEELLLVKGVTPQLLFGNDMNRNGVLDPEESDIEGGSGGVDQGWSAYLTVYSRQQNVDSNGNGRIYLNDPDTNTLQTELQAASSPVAQGSFSQDLINFIILARQPGSQLGSASGAAGMGKGNSTNAGANRSTATSAMAGTKGNSGTKGLQNISSVWNLVGAQVTVGSGRNQKVIQSPLNDPNNQQTMLPLLLDTCTTSQSSDLSARINVNTAGQTVLTALAAYVTQMQDADIQNIIGAQPTAQNPSTDPSYNTPAWLLTKANVSLATVKKMAPYITATSQVYRFQSFGYFAKGGPVSRVEAVVDTNTGRPRIVYLRDITELGRGFDMNTLSGTGGSGN